MQKIKDYIYYNRKEIITVIICLSLFGSYLIFKKNDSYIIEENIIKEEQVKTLIIDIKGEVKNPGTYEFNEDNRIIDAIEKSGGLTDKADTTNINLSEKLKDEMLIIIPSIEEKKEIIVDNKETSNAKTTKEVKDSKISINTASVKELMTINGIGQTKAQAIVDYRNTNGLFKDIKDILKVSGIGNSTFEKIKDYIKI
jgi:competence protein ComEA